MGRRPRGRMALTSALREGCTMSACYESLTTYVLDSGGELARALLWGGGKQVLRPEGNSPKDIFPLPLMKRFPLPVRGRSRARADKRNSFVSTVNLAIVSLNYMYAGKTQVCRAVPSAAQRRVHQCIFSTVSHFLRSGQATSGEKGIQKYLLEDLHS